MRFRKVRGDTNFLVSIKTVGRALLRHMVENLGMDEMKPLYEIEEGKGLEQVQAGKLQIRPS